MINKTLLAVATSLTLLAAGTANAQIGKAASEATDAAPVSYTHLRAHET